MFCGLKRAGRTKEELALAFRRWDTSRQPNTVDIWQNQEQVKMAKGRSEVEINNTPRTLTEALPEVSVRMPGHLAAGGKLKDILLCSKKCDLSPIDGIVFYDHQTEPIEMRPQTNHDRNVNTAGTVAGDGLG